MKKDYQHDFNMEKRIRVMIRDHGFIEFMFRDLDSALMSCAKYATQLLDNLMVRLSNIRNKLIEKGATQKQILAYDDKIDIQFHRLIKILENRKNFEVLDKIKDYGINMQIAMYCLAK